ncbi:MAG: hypothetical protein KIS78_14090 [Labilithrix sp.]|nr:hypothetical protein [Labilithrix sp.]
MSEDERAACVDALPGEVPLELHPPEGERHWRAKDGVVSALHEFFRRVGRKIYRLEGARDVLPGRAHVLPGRPRRP